MPDPMWKQIAEDLRQKIEAGQVGRDRQPLPTELELQAEYSASRNTVRDAIKWLVTRGLVYTRSGQGTFVTQKTDPFVTRLLTSKTLLSAEDSAGHVGLDSAAYASQVASQRRRPTMSDPRVEIQQARGLAAAELRLPAGASVISRHQQRFIDGVPYSLQTTFYPMRLLEGGAIRLIEAVDIKSGTVRYVEQTLGIQETGLRDRIKVRVPDAPETDFFGLPDDGRIAVFEYIRTGFEVSGQPLRVTVTSYPADRNQFLIESGDVPEQHVEVSDKTGEDEPLGTNE
jgi:GntR family transcriptional regulator